MESTLFTCGSKSFLTASFDDGLCWWEKLFLYILSTPAHSHRHKHGPKAPKAFPLWPTLKQLIFSGLPEPTFARIGVEAFRYQFQSHALKAPRILQWLSETYYLSRSTGLFLRRHTPSNRIADVDQAGDEKDNKLQISCCFEPYTLLRRI